MYKSRLLTLCLIFTFAFGTSGFAQMKIGHANLELIMVYMPEVKTMNQQLETYQKMLAQQLQTKQNYAQDKLQEYQNKHESGQFTQTAQREAEVELQKLDAEIKKFAQDAEIKVAQKQQDLMAPIMNKIQKAIDEVAAADGYTYIINQAVNGVSTLLHAPEEHNLNEKIMRKLGIQIPSDGN